MEHHQLDLKIVFVLEQTEHYSDWKKCWSCYRLLMTNINCI